MEANKFNQELFKTYIVLKKVGKTYRNISKASGVSSSTFNRIVEDSDYETTLDNILKICDWLQVSVRIFFN